MKLVNTQDMFEVRGHGVTIDISDNQKAMVAEYFRAVERLGKGSVKLFSILHGVRTEIVLQGKP